LLVALRSPNIPTMFVVTEADAAAIRTAYEQGFQAQTRGIFGSVYIQ
jgi:hypothetical protein